MTISNFYSSIMNSGRKHGPTFQESQHDYRLAREAQMAGVFTGNHRQRARAALHAGFGRS